MTESERGETGNPALRVSVVARSPVVEYGIVGMLEWAGFTVVADSGDGFSDSVTYPDSGLDPDVIVVDTVQSNETSGPEFQPEYREFPVVFITDAAPVLPARTDGSRPTAWLRWEAGREELAAAVRAVAAGLDVYDPGLGGALGRIQTRRWVRTGRRSLPSSPRPRSTALSLSRRGRLRFSGPLPAV